MATESIWIDDKLVDASEANIGFSDHGITVGDGVFESIGVVDGSPFALQRHLDRLRRSARAIGLDIGRDDDLLRLAVNSVIEANDAVGVIRMTVTGGSGPMGSARGDGPPRLIVAAAPPRGWAETTTVITVEWTRNERSALAGVKSTSYAENVVALARAKEAGATEALMSNTRGQLCEGTGTNIFVELDGRLATPPLDSGCLAGVTRALVIEGLAAGGVEVLEVAIPFEHLQECTEAFLTSSTRDVQGISAIDGRAIAAPGPLTRLATQALADVRAGNIDP
ncbi:MAG: aminotransferase class IV [Acidimicrobiales bacterium]|nr:aminotransferase class IV family protein [Acidimicrobiales bacterium]